MRPTLLTGLFAIAVMVAPSSASATAENTHLFSPSKVQNISESTAILPILEKEAALANLAKAADAMPVEPVVKTHAVAPNENLATIAQQHGTDWYRLFNKNVQLSHPDQLKPGDTVTIPEPNEQLAERPLPQPPVQEETAPVQSQSVVSPSKTGRQQSTVSMSRGSSSGNTYAPGYCTWYAKNMRPDLPNNLGNADTWVSRASAQGIPTGSTPRVGAIGQQGMHVVYVERVNDDGTVFISEMNYKGRYVTSTRIVAASSFMYIY